MVKQKVIVVTLVETDHLPVTAHLPSDAWRSGNYKSFWIVL